MWEAIRAQLLKPRTLLIVYIGAAIFAAIQLYSLGTHEFTFPKDPFPEDIMNKPQYMNLFFGKYLTEYNNYRIFKYSFYHLLSGSNLYGIYPDLHWDFYKYSPTFALFMGPMACLPDLVGLSIWNILNAVVLFWGIRMLPFKVSTRSLLMWYVALELLTCLQNTQSNGLMCGLMIAGYGSMQRGKMMWAALWLILATYIKVYGIIGCCLFLFYQQKPKFLLYCVVWGVVLGALPLLVTPLHTLLWQYQNWAELLRADAVAATGLSVAGWLHTWFGLDNVKGAVTVAGLLLFLIPFARVSMYKDNVFRLLTLAAMLLWVIIFNHKAESPTFVIAVAGVGIWYFAMPRATWRTVLLFFVFLFTCMSTTDLFPPYVKQHLIYPYTIKAFPCIVAWCVIFVELMLLRRDRIEGHNDRLVLS